MKTIETKVTKTGAITVKVDGTRAKFDEAISAIRALILSGDKVCILTHYHSRFVGHFDGKKSYYVFQRVPVSSCNGKYTFTSMYIDLALKEFARGEFGEFCEFIPA